MPPHALHPLRATPPGSPGLSRRAGARDDAVPPHRHSARASFSGVVIRVPTSEEQSVGRRIRQCDRAVVADLYAEHGGVVLGALRRILDDRGAAEDVLQEVFVEAWRRGATYDPSRGSVLGWLLGIARNRAIDELRRRRPTPIDPHARLQQVASEEDAIDGVLGEWRLAALLRTLPEDEASVLAMRFRDGLSQSEIAERTGIPMGTIKMRMVRGLERLRELVEREEGRA